jgi:hypothetical protein
MGIKEVTTLDHQHRVVVRPSHVAAFALPPELGRTLQRSGGTCTERSATVSPPADFPWYY